MKHGDKLTAKELDILINSWEPGTQESETDRKAIEALDKIGAEIGYGWLKQIAQFLYETQCHGLPKGAADMKRSRFQSLGWALPRGFEEVASR